MSKLSNLIGFWNSKSTEVETVTFPKPKPEGIKIRKWENGHNFANSLEYSKDSGDSFRRRGGDRNVGNVRPVTVIGSPSDCDERFKGPAKCVGKDVSKVDKSEKRGVAEPSGDKADKIVPEKPSARDSDAGNEARKEKGDEGDRQIEKELIREKEAGSDPKSGKPGTPCPTPLKSPTQCPPISPLAGPPSSHPSSPTSPRSPISSTSRDKPISPFARFKQLENDQTQSNPGSRSSPTPPMPSRGTNLYRNSSLPASPRPTITHAQMAAPGQSLGAVAARSGSGAKEMILMWVQNRIKDYPIPMTNFSTCWNDGLAFCAIIHVFYPENFDWYALKAENRRYNFTLGFDKAEELAGIYPLLEVDDMVRFKKPDWKCVFTYVQSFYRRFRDGRSPPKSGPTIPCHTQVTLSAVAQAVAESQAAENKGRQIVAQIPTDKTVAAAAPSSNQSKVFKTPENGESNKETPSPKQPDTVSPTKTKPKPPPLQCTLAPEASTPSPIPSTEAPQDTHREQAHISLKQIPQPSETQSVSGYKSSSLSPTSLSPTNSTSSKESWKSCRSKSVASDQPSMEDKATPERKYSYNHPLPSAPPPIVSFNNRQ